MDTRDMLVLGALAAAVLVVGHLRSKRRRLHRLASRPVDRSTHEDDAEVRALVAKVEAKKATSKRKKAKQRAEGGQSGSAAFSPDGLEAATLLGAIVVGPTTNATVTLGRRVGDGFAVSVVIEASKTCIVQPLAEGDFLVQGTMQNGAVIYLGPRASAADRAWAAHYDDWQAQELENGLASLVGGDTVDAEAPPPHSLSGVVMRASRAIDAGYPSTNAVAGAALGEAEACDAAPAEAWVMMVGIDPRAGETLEPQQAC